MACADELGASAEDVSTEVLMKAKKFQNRKNKKEQDEKMDAT